MSDRAIATQPPGRTADAHALRAQPRPPVPTDFAWTIVPHTHWDREWYQPFELFRLRLVRMFDELLDVLETEPAITAFSLDGQAVILEDYLEVRPEQAPRVRALLEAGRLAAGPSYVLPDEFLAPQEALVRNLLIGTRVSRDAGARPTRVGYQPDPFGHVAQLPQVLRGFGLDTFLFWRGLGEEADHLGSLFGWRAPDGSTVVAVRQLGGYGNASQMGRWGRQGRDYLDEPGRWPDVAADRLQRYLDTWGDEVRRDGIGQLLLCNGSDHQSVWRPLPDLLEAVRGMYPGIDLRVGTYDDYVDALEVDVTTLPMVAGELRSGREAHLLRGIESIRMPLKQAGERASVALLAAEAAASLAILGTRIDGAAPARPDPRPGLDRAWKLLLRNLPHDSISGCSVDPVHREMEGRFELVEQLAGWIGSEAVAALGDLSLPWDPALAAADRRVAAASIINPLPDARVVLVELPLPPELARGRGALVAELGVGRTVVPAQRVAGAVAIAVPIDGFGSTVVRVREGRTETLDGVGRFRAGGSWIESGRFRVDAADDGTFTLTDRSTGRVASGLGQIEDAGDRGDEYTFCPLDASTTPAPGFVMEAVQRRVRAIGPAFAELEIIVAGSVPDRLAPTRRRRVGRVRLVTRTRIRIVAGADRVDVVTTLRNRARDHRLRLLFPARDAAAEVRAEGQFAVIRRPAAPVAPGRPERWAELPAPTSHTSGFVAAGSLVVIGRGLPEYEAIPHADGGVDLALTLLRCVGWLSQDDLSTRPGGAGPHIATPDAQALGPHEFSYAVRLDGDLDDTRLVRASADARWPVVFGPAGVEARGGLGVRGNVAFAALKPAERGGAVVLRLYNPGPDRSPFGIDCATAVPWRVRLDEAPAEDSALPETLGPGEILSIRLEPRG